MSRPLGIAENLELGVAVAAGSTEAAEAAELLFPAQNGTSLEAVVGEKTSSQLGLGGTHPGSGASSRPGISASSREDLQVNTSSSPQRVRSRLSDAVQKKPQLLLVAPSQLAEQVSAQRISFHVSTAQPNQKINMKVDISMIEEDMSLTEPREFIE
jgi:hypothetical protein